MRHAAGCVIKTAVDISNQNLAVQVTADRTTIAKGETTLLRAVASGGSGNYQYTWQPTEGLTALEKGKASVAPVKNETYNVLVKDGNGCGTTGTYTIDVTQTQQGSKTSASSVPLSMVAVETAIKVTPNRGSGNFNVKLAGFQKGKVEINVLDATGKQVAHKALNTAAHQTSVPFNLSRLPKGIYIVNVVSGEKSFQEKLVIR